MKKEELIALLEETPVIAAVKDDAGLKKSLACGSRAVFVLYGNVVNVAGIVAQIKAAGKAALIHADLIDGLSPREAAVDYIAAATQADGILSTKPALVRYARGRGLLGIQRFFLLDSIALQNVRKLLASEDADLVEVLPGVMPKVIRRLAAETGKPIIAGGLISDKEDIVAALGAGALAVSATDPGIWFM